MAGYCPNCGREEIDPGKRFCESCGAEIGAPLPGAPSELPGAPAGLPGAPAGSQIPWKWIAPLAAAGLVLVIAIVAAVLIFSGNGGDAAPAPAANATVGNTDRTGTTGPGTTNTQADAKRQAQVFIAKFDSIVADNARLEQLGISYANQINSGGAPVITDAMLNQIDQLRQQFRAARDTVQALDTPATFRQVQKDFLQLNAYNSERAESLYNTAVAWRAGGSTEQFYQAGQLAKANYQALYPVFEQEYGDAKAAVR